MSPETEKNIALVIATLNWLQDSGGDVRPRGQVTPEYLAHFSREIGVPVSRSTFRRVEEIALAKARHRASSLTNITTKTP